MSTSTFKLKLSYNQILDIVKQLPAKEKLKLTKELAKETVDQQLTDLLASFQTDELTDEIIDSEVESVRAEIYAQKSKT